MIINFSKILFIFIQCAIIFLVMTTLYTFATYEEAESSIARTNASQVSPGLFEFVGGKILITGIGPLASYLATQAFIDSVDSVVNLGLAGSLKQEHTLGKIYTIGSVHLKTFCPKTLKCEHHFALNHCKPVHFEQDGLVLCTSDKPIYTQSQELLHFDLVDMEGYSIALVAQSKNKPCTLIKLVSDYCNTETSNKIRDTLPIWSQLFADYIFKIKTASFGSLISKPPL